MRNRLRDVEVFYEGHGRYYAARVELQGSFPKTEFVAVLWRIKDRKCAVVKRRAGEGDNGLEFARTFGVFIGNSVMMGEREADDNARELVEMYKRTGRWSVEIKESEVEK